VVQQVPQEDFMMSEQSTADQQARTFARIAGEAWQDQAEYFRSLPEDAWSGPTGCARWTMHHLAGHSVGEAVWFLNLLCGVTQGEAPLPGSTWDELKGLPGRDMADRLMEAGRSLPPAVEGASADQLEQTVDMSFATMPLWRAVGINMLEAVYHNWDARIGRAPDATVPTKWAQQLATFATDFVPTVARHDVDAAGQYLLRVGDGVGPVTLTADDGRVVLERDESGTADVTLRLTADQYVRLLGGRLPLDAAIEDGRVSVQGSRERAVALNRIFAGIAN